MKNEAGTRKAKTVTVVRVFIGGRVIETEIEGTLLTPKRKKGSK